jgi:hypothetical protein
MFPMDKARWSAATVVLLALAIVPAPLLPPHGLAEVVQSTLGLGWQAAYLAAAIGLQTVFYLALGVVAAFVVKRAATSRGRWLQILVVPLIVVAVSFVIRCAKAGHLPVWINAAVPVVACLTGTWLGLGLLHRRWKTTLTFAVAGIALASWVLLNGASASLIECTESRLQRLVSAGPSLPSGEARFGALLQAAFASEPADLAFEGPVQHNRAAILALGVAVGHERLARLIGMKPDSALVQQAAALRPGTTLRDREDWPRHFCLSAALAVLEHPLVSDAGGLMKEQLDALTQGTGFSFADLAADRAGVRFAQAATASDSAARAMLLRLQRGYSADDFFPPAADLPESLTLERFRLDYGGVGTKRYRLVVEEIEQRLNRCAGLSVSRRQD